MLVKLRKKIGFDLFSVNKELKEWVKVNAFINHL